MRKIINIENSVGKKIHQVISPDSDTYILVLDEDSLCFLTADKVYLGDNEYTTNIMSLTYDETAPYESGYTDISHIIESLYYSYKDQESDDFEYMFVDTKDMNTWIDNWRESLKKEAEMSKQQTIQNIEIQIENLQNQLKTLKGLKK